MSVHTIQLKVLTPTHVGVGPENNYVFGVDYITEGRENAFIFFDANELLRSLTSNERTTLSNLLISQKFDDMVAFVKPKLANLKSKDTIPSRVPLTKQDIKRHYKTGLGVLTIPGSSIKGAVRSVLASALHGGAGGTINLDSLLGKFGNSIMRHIHITDAMFESVFPDITVEKIFSADFVGRYEYAGTWKNERLGGHVPNFNDTGFTQYYESLPVDAETQFRISWPELNNPLQQRIVSSTPNVAKIFNGDGVMGLWNSIKRNTDAFIEKELTFYERYQNDDITSSGFFDELAWIKEQNNLPNTCVLRVGSSVGFHSITGDWKFNDHTATGINPKTNAINYKTRKVSFDYHQEEDEYLFYAPGFVQLTLLP